MIINVPNYKQKRLFFALWPDDQVRSEISQVYSASSYAQAEGRSVVPQNLHLTLHFLGNVSLETCECVSNMASKIQLETFNLKLDNFGVFKKPKVFWMGVTDIPQPLMRLYIDLGEQLKDCDYRMEKRVFTPHVSLKRKINNFELKENPCSIVNWRVNRFALVESRSTENGVNYRPIEYYKI
ncbi:MAG: RNA 2',3'-cyclic phosphodiesterase [endosymbiont of Galathealinum brachiosum]|uniref:RNA 2',3'-cyclic phosphodiesterase n=1 Tax=endosymbiont of Galathealinum brachiosum TaxID=2200906 RepID=A0A370DHV7_9GAMM|nr:MAG: RNA 2',3'-cyclic phosphodiesterase [endosymbiont of Galathealinum brachiosum]